MNNFEEEIMTKYADFLKIQSVSVEKRGIVESLDWLENKFEECDAKEIIIGTEFKSSPIIIGKFEGKSDKTILIYNHYDVQPIDNIELWETSPFEPTIKNGKLYCRGASDCKGEIISRLMVIDYFQKNGGLPCNVVYFIEGEEEIGSPNLKKYIEIYQNDLKSDVCLWECGWKNEKEQLEISCGVKGILSFDLEVSTAKKAIHSAYAGIIPNSAWQLIQCLASMKDNQNQVLINGFYDDVLSMSFSLSQAIDELDFDSSSFKSINGIFDELLGSTYQLTLVNEPTFNISQIHSGEVLSNNSIPPKATAKIDCRFVPNQTPDKILNLVEQHLEDNNFKHIKITNISSESAYRSDLSNPFIRELIESVKQVYGEGDYQLIPNFSGGGPMSLFGTILKVPIFSIGCSYSGSNVHSINENIRLSDFEQNFFCLKNWFERVGN